MISSGPQPAPPWLPLPWRGSCVNIHHPNAPPLFFVHIPKTAGLSLHWAMVNAFPVDAALRLNSERELWSLPLRQVERLSYLSAHARYGLKSIFLEQPSVFTFLRHPVDRSVSAYWHLRSEDAGKFDNPEFRAAIEECQSRALEDIAFDDSSPALSQLGNVQTWYLCGPNLLESPGERESEVRVGDVFARGPDKNALEIGDRELALAIAALEEMSLFGIVERMQDSLTVLEKAFGLHPSAVPFINAAKSPLAARPVDNRVRARLEELAELDMRLYQRALEIFRQRGNRPGRSLPDFKPFASSNPGVAPQRCITCRADDGFIGGGWYPRDVGDKGSWVWNGLADESWIEMFVDVDNDLELSIELKYCLDWEIARNTGIKVAGVTLPTKFHRELRGGRLSARIPKSLTGDGPRVIRITVPIHRTVRPSDTSGNRQDTRTLALAMASFSISQ